MAMEMRPYQQEARQAVHEQWEDVDRTLLVLPTGTGKTIVFSKIVDLHWQLVSGNGRICADSHERKTLKAV